MAPDRGLTVREWGVGGDPRVVCWPGLDLSAHAHFAEAGPILAERFGLHVLAVEPPGWTSPPLSAPEYRLVDAFDDTVTAIGAFARSR